MTVPPEPGITVGAPSEDPITAGCTTVECQLQSTLAAPETVLAAVLLGLAAFVAVAYIADARRRCENERSRARSEQEAFEEFESFVSSLETKPIDTDVPQQLSGSVLTRRALSDGGVSSDRILAGYERTVMDVPHYEEEYDDTVYESLVAELGADTAAAIVSSEPLSPELQSALLARSRHARRTRSSLIDAVDEELETLDRAGATAEAIDTKRRRFLTHFDGTAPGASFDAGIDIWHGLDELEADCETALDDRQAAFENPPLVRDDHGISFYEYLYRPLEGTDHPVLSQFVTLTERLREDKARIERAILQPR